jgi:hypothetical protein
MRQHSTTGPHGLFCRTSWPCYDSLPRRNDPRDKEFAHRVCYEYRTNGTRHEQSRLSMLGYLRHFRLAPVLQRVAFPLSFSLAGPLSKIFLTRDSTVLHSDLFPEFPCDGELIPMEELSTQRLRVLWCSGCGTEFTYTPDCSWITVVYPGMKSDLEM